MVAMYMRNRSMVFNVYFVGLWNNALTVIYKKLFLSNKRSEICVRIFKIVL